jgi:hypothetical protein
MKNITEFIKGRKLSVFSLSVGLVGVLLAIIFYFNPLNSKNIHYNIQNFPLFEDYVQQIEGIQIFVDGKEIKNLTVSNIIIWNSGNSVIEYNDIPIKNQLSIKLLNDNTEIISTKVLYQTNIGNDVFVNIIDDHSILFGFEYLNKNDGFVIQILHTEKGLNANNVFGEIKGVGEIKHNINSGINNNIGIFFNIFYIIVFLFIFTLFYTKIELNILNKIISFFLKIFICLIITLIILFIIFLLMMLLIIIFNSVIPTFDFFKIGIPIDLRYYFNFN